MPIVPRRTALILLVWGGCTPSANLEGLPPPCARGWTEVDGVCVRGRASDAGLDDASPHDAVVDGSEARVDACLETESACDGRDEDCDGRTDEGLTGRWYRDVDSDGAGRELVEGCGSAELVASDGDCNDDDPRRRGGCVERCDAVDNDCDETIDEGACPPGCVVEQSGETRYVLCESSGTWFAARDRCEQMGNDLPAARSSSEWDVLVALRTRWGADDRLWLGMSDERLEGSWVTPEGELVFDEERGVTEDGFFVSWALDEPNGDETENCVGLWSTEAIDVPCGGYESNPIRTVCRVDQGFCVVE
jgi:hypothetical protein